RHGQSDAFVKGPGDQRRLAVARVARDDHARDVDLRNGLEDVDHAADAPGPGHQGAAVDVGAEQLIDAAGAGAVLAVGGDLRERQLGDSVAAAREGRETLAEGRTASFAE